MNKDISQDHLELLNNSRGNVINAVVSLSHVPYKSRRVRAAFRVLLKESKSLQKDIDREKRWRLLNKWQ